jgi:hypothetical protein
MTAVNSERVGPGDVIRSDLINKLLAKVESLDTRVVALESGGGRPEAPVITGHLPQGDIVAGGELRVLGRKFLVPTNQNTVTVDTKTFSSFLPGSNDGQLILDLPDDFQGLPKDVTLAVANRNGTSTATVRLQPAVQIPGGQLLVADTTGTLGEVIKTGQTYTFTYRLESQTDIPETYDVAPVFTNAVGSTAAAWRAGAVTLGGDVLSLDAFKPLEVGVRVQVPAGAQQVDFALALSSRHSADPKLNRTSTVRSLVVGQQQEVNDPRTALILSEIGPASPHTRGAVLDGTAGVQVHFGNHGPVPVDITPTVTGTYRYEAKIENGGGLWSVAPPSPGQAPETANNRRPMSLDVTCNAPGPAPERRFLVVHAVKLRDDGTDEFSSYLRFPIEGFPV